MASVTSAPVPSRDVGIGTPSVRAESKDDARDGGFESNAGVPRREAFIPLLPSITSDLYERQSAQLVLETTADADIKAFATMMVSAHAKSTATVTPAAKRSKIMVSPPMLMPAQVEMIAQLKAENGPARDAAYLAQQKAAHGQVLSVQKAYAMGGTAPVLKAAAAQIVPVVEDHVAMLKKRCELSQPDDPTWLGFPHSA